MRGRKMFGELEGRIELGETSAAPSRFCQTSSAPPTASSGLCHDGRQFRCNNSYCDAHASEALRSR